MRKVLLLVLAFSVVAGAASAGPTRVDINGYLNAPKILNPGQIDTTIWPADWNSYGMGVYGDLGSSYNTGSSSNARAVRAENDGITPGTTQGGYSVIFGGARDNTQGAWGIKQTIQSKANKLYTFMGGANYGGSATVYLDWGIENGTGIDAGNLTKSNYSSGLNGKREFLSTVIGNGGDLTYHIGQRTLVSGTNAGINTWADGIRVWEWDTTAQSIMLNGNFEGAGTNLTQYNGRFADGARDWVIPEGWILTGTTMGKNEGVWTGTSTSIDSKIPARAGNILAMDCYTGEGKKFVMQKVKYGGAGFYDLSGYVLGWGAIGGAPRIGIDPTGGLDPTGANVIWTSTVGAANVWETKSLTDVFSADGYATIFMGTGPGSYLNAGAGAAFDDISLTFRAVPEPSSILALASGLVGMAGFAVRRRK